MYITTSFVTILIIFDGSLFFKCCDSLDFSQLDFCNNNVTLGSCNERKSSPSSRCLDYENLIHSDVERKIILDRINSRRNKVASGEIRSLPSASNMRKLSWSRKLAESAQEWANQCVTGDVPDIKDNCLDHEEIGQNIATVYGDAPGLAAQSLVDVWYMELLNMNSSVSYRYIPPNTAKSLFYEHFTQMIWAETSMVGCGAVKFKDCVKEGNSGKSITVYRLVCNFSPKGNAPYEEVYQSGPACSQCAMPSICDSTLTSLCSVESEELTTSDSTMIDSFAFESNSTKKSKEQLKETETFTEHSAVQDEPLTPYDFTSSLRHLSIPLISIPTPTPTTDITNGMKIDELVEIVKKKLSTDIAFKNVLANKNSQAERDYSDSNVEAFVSQIYTSKVPATTEITSNNEYINSTLLADLIEAVIFRNTLRNEAIVTSTESFKITQNNNPVFPKKIQAELGDVPTNSYFTGHLFIPEDVDDEPKTTTEVEYETYVEKKSDIPLLDVLSEIEQNKQHKVTSDFLAELLETEYVTENVEIVEIEKDAEKSKDQDTSTNVSPAELENIETRKKRSAVMNKKRHLTKKEMSNFNGLKSDEKYQNSGYLIRYSDLLKQLAADLNAIKLNEKLACFSINKSFSTITHDNRSLSFKNLFLLVFQLIILNV